MTTRGRVVLCMVLTFAAGGCASAPPAPIGTLTRSPAAPIPLRAGYWVPVEFQAARFTGGGVDDVAFGDIMASGLVALAQANFRESAQFASRGEAIASPLVDVVVAPTVDAFTMMTDPESLTRELATVRIEWRITDKAGRVRWQNLVVTERREICVIQRCRKELAERAVREHFEAAAAEMRSAPWWQQPR